MNKNEAIEVLKKWAAWTQTSAPAQEYDKKAARAVMDLISYAGTLESKNQYFQQVFNVLEIEHGAVLRKAHETLRDDMDSAKNAGSHPPVAIL